MAAKPKPKTPKPTDAERHERFVQMAHEVGASDDPKEFDRAFERLARKGASPANKTGAKSDKSG